MLLKITLISILLPLLLLNEKDTANNSDEKLTKYEIRGTMQYTSFHQGGIERLNENLFPYPLANCTLLVVCVNDKELIPTVVGEIKSDAKGNFSIHLPSGKYGFVQPQDVERLQPGQCLPSGIQSPSGMHESFSSFWGSSIQCPIDLTQNSVDGLIITNERRTMCMDCP